ncbi:hypothetical protein GOP47_0012243 [Adiantum capillus-veneris]|uniref:endo-polygalacturonase n=1 Tax=Adiantum capillus-veneris TaxID=13818 RepID=A0A9D4UQT8_ADICA|nr:hypothetical protein GOP47_0012243 [Adiantum capillus-veneris]
MAGLSSSSAWSTLLILSYVCIVQFFSADGRAVTWPCQLSSFVDGYADCDADHDGTWPPYDIVNVDWYGAIGDGLTDDTQAFINAWNEACSLDSAVLLIPYNKTYLVNHLELKGPCGGSLVVELAGILVAPADPSLWNKSHSNAWLHFSHLSGLSVEGGGTIDGQGQQWWDQSCKRNKKNKCHDAPTALRFSSVSNLKVRDLLSLNSPQIHIKFANCYGVEVVNLQVSAPEDSPNTDGIHVSETQNVIIQDSSIGTGDDCVSIVRGSADVRVQNITCGPGHGISIGSLGKSGSEDFVSVVVVNGANLTGTSNGVRIKTWQGGSGAAVGVIFENIQMNNVSHPIIINQKYCDSSSSCSANETSAVQVSQVYYKNIKGTSATKQAIQLECSELAPCKNLLFENVDLVREAGKGNSTTECENAHGFVMGRVFPPVDCMPLSQQAEKLLHTTM